MLTEALSFERHMKAVQSVRPLRVGGRVTKVVGLVMEGYAPGASVGEFCNVFPKGSNEPVQAEVVGFTDEKVLLMPLGEVRGIGPGSMISVTGACATVSVGECLLGRTINALGEPIDGLGHLNAHMRYPIHSAPPAALGRKRIDKPLNVGIRAINSMLTVGRGQRVGIFAGSGVGKSVLLGMMARSTEAHVNVIALVGERGREVKEFIERDLGEEGLKRSVLVVATSDQPPVIRMRAPLVATAIAEYFRDQGCDVLLMMDSVTRFAMAQREIGLAVGEPPATKGYPPSVFAHIPRLLERAGTSSGKGTITGFYTVLAEGDDVNDPVADCARSILDGHIVLTRELAAQGHFPAIDVLQSISRVMNDIVSDGHRHFAQKARAVLATYKKAYDLVSIGAYKQGSDPKVDHAIAVIDRVTDFLKQDISVKTDYDDSLQALFSLGA